MNPVHPIYIVSKGRWERSLTSRHLHRMSVPHYVVVEQQEFEHYAALLGPLATLLALDPIYQRRYDACDALGDRMSKGSGPARNFAWDHAISFGAKWHWVCDDNLNGFYMLNHNLKVPVRTGSIFRIAEDFVDRYENVAQAGFQYYMFCPRKRKLPPIYVNTRIYSCILIRNDIPFRWRGRYNEDTDLSIRILKDGNATVLFNAFLADKATTMTMKGGNTDALYRGDGRLRMAESLRALHPDVVKIAWKWNRFQHSVDYRSFRGNALRLKPDAMVPDGANKYGMILRTPTPQRRVDNAAASI